MFLVQISTDAGRTFVTVIKTDDRAFANAQFSAVTNYPSYETDVVRLVRIDDNLGLVPTDVVDLRA